MKKNKIMFEQIPVNKAMELLGTETIKRLNKNNSNFQFSGYNVRVPGYICIPVKLSEDCKKRAIQQQELQQLGYTKLSKQIAEEYQITIKENSQKIGYYSEENYIREIYKISINELLEIHSMEI